MPTATVSALLIFVTAALFTVAVFWTVSNWGSVNPEERHEWAQRTCTVDGKAVAEFSGSWRNDFLVSNFTKREERAPDAATVAYRYGTPVYNQTRTAATAFADAFDVNAKYPCWVTTGLGARSANAHTSVRQGNSTNVTVDAAGFSVSMTAAGVLGASSSFDFALPSTLFCVVMFSALLLALFSATRHNTPSQVRSDLVSRPRVPTGTVQPNSISKAQIALLCSSAVLAAKERAGTHSMSSADMDTCAICLEDGPGNGEMAQLRCQHRFHLMCVRGWLLRGGVTCPLCNYSMAKEFAKGEPEISDEASDAERSPAGAADDPTGVLVLERRDMVDSGQNLRMRNEGPVVVIDERLPGTVGVRGDADVAISQ